MAIKTMDWLDNVYDNDLIVLIDYFGFPMDISCVNQAKAQGAWILEDASQALLSQHVGHFSDFVLFSPRKFLGVPDGGVLIVDQKVELDSITLESPPATWWLKTLTAAILRRDFDLYEGSHRWFELFQEIETEFPIGAYAMSEFSEMLLRHSFDYSMIAERRVENYQYLAYSLNHLAVFPNLTKNVVPLGFPIRVKERDCVRKALFDNKIYPPVHWQIHDFVPKKFRDSHRLSAEIMTLPCDQRYDRIDMDRMIRIMKKFTI